MTLIDMTSAPEDPFDQILWLENVEAELEKHRQRLAFEIRLSGRLEALVSLGLFSRTRILAWCRRENRARGTSVHWNDFADQTSHR